MRAGFFAFAAADTFHAVWFFVYLDIGRAGVLAGGAFCAGGFVHAVAPEGDWVEKSVDSSQGAEIFAEWPVYPEGEDDKRDEKHALPREEPAD